jgi:hypothetical protein
MEWRLPQVGGAHGADGDPGGCPHLGHARAVPGRRHPGRLGTLRRGDVLGLVRRDIDLESGAARVERDLHEYHDGSLELGPTENGFPARSTRPTAFSPPFRVARTTVRRRRVSSSLHLP